LINVYYKQMIASISIYLHFAKKIQQITAGKHQNIHGPLLFQNEHHHLFLYRLIAFLHLDSHALIGIHGDCIIRHTSGTTIYEQQPIHGKAKCLIPIDSPIHRSFQYALV
jgi:hypothetical protein